MNVPSQGAHNPTTDNPTTAGTSDTGGPVGCPPDDGLPSEGAACAMEGDVCSGLVDVCQPHVRAECHDGVWQYVDVTPDPEQCTDSCDPFPVEGEPCKFDGSSCSSGCDNQCEFCNGLVCTGGQWQNFEVFPAPCLDCESLCDLTLAPMCAAGPPDEAACVAGCMDAMAGRCEIPFSNLNACVGTQPMPVAFTCDAEMRPLVEACADEFEQYYACAGL
ncbi:MAG: hypothetical protein JNL82_28965 [Myxococcales bacterium]|nr:hypothetical protein [Myxococcales bacterium]